MIENTQEPSLEKTRFKSQIVTSGITVLLTLMYVADVIVTKVTEPSGLSITLTSLYVVPLIFVLIAIQLIQGARNRRRFKAPKYLYIAEFVAAFAIITVTVVIMPYSFFG